MRLLFTFIAAVHLLQESTTGGAAASVPSSIAASGPTLGDTIGCEVCESVISVIQTLFDQSWNKDFIARVVARICVSLKLTNVDETVCKGLVELFKDEVFTVTTSIANPRLICSLISSCPSPPNPLKPWYVPLPQTSKPPIQPVPVPPPGSPVSRILHLSDIHYDPLYVPGLTNQCGEPLCCRIPNAKGTTPTNTAGFWGDYACDPPLWLVENAFQFLASIQDSFDWIYVTGDLPPHDVWSETKETTLDVIGVTYDLIRKYLPTKPVYSAIGNHDTSPVNSFPPPFVTGSLSEQWLYDFLAKQWEDWLPSDALTTLKRGGFYVAKIQEGLKVISLQTNFGYHENYWLFMNETDPAGHLAWLVEQLQTAEDNGEKVHIIGHIPPSLTLHSWSYNFYNILNRYESTIVGQFYGHTHHDEFIVAYDQLNTTRPIGVAFVEPAITTFTDANPGFCFSIIDGNYPNSTYSMLDKECYYMNLTEANLYNATNWQFEYSAKKSYDMNAFQPSDFDNLIHRMERNITLATRYAQYYSKMASLTPPNLKQVLQNLVWLP